MPLTFKLVTVLATMAALLSMMFPPLVAQARHVLDDFPALTRW